MLAIVAEEGGQTPHTDAAGHRVRSFTTEGTEGTEKNSNLLFVILRVLSVLRGERYCRLAGGMMLFMRRYSTIWP